jgi:hypothetical protein
VLVPRCAVRHGRVDGTRDEGRPKNRLQASCGLLILGLALALALGLVLVVEVVVLVLVLVISERENLH